MREAAGDLWTYDAEPVAARVITTNGYVTKDGKAVLGRGVARQAVERFGDGLKTWLGDQIQKFGNHVHAAQPAPALGRPYWLITFPVKPSEGADGTPGWKCEADPILIGQSANELLYWTLGMLFDTPGAIVMPRPGCGNGRLSWDEVRGPLANILDQSVRFENDAIRTIGDRFVVVHPEGATS